MVSWRNWGRTYTAHPLSIQHPASEDEIVAIVRAAAERGEPVKVAGSGHSFTDIAVTDGRLLLLDRYNRLLHVDTDTGRATVEAGITIEALTGALAGFGLGLENQGDVAYQTISGAISTATHGTGETFRNISSQVRGLRLVTGTGDVVECSAERDPELFKAAQVSLGALGVISTVTLQCVPAFNLRNVREPKPVDELVSRFDEICAANDHFEFYWFPHTDAAMAITTERTQEPVTGKGRAGFGAYVNDILFENYAFAALQRGARLNRRWIPALARFGARTMSKQEIFDRSDRVFANPRFVRFAEMEYAVPRERLLDAFADVRRMIERKGFLISFPVEVRATAADDIFLSTASGRATGYLAVHVYYKFEYEPYFREVEAVMNAYEGRPHWGKLHFQDAVTLRARYPLWDRFLAARDRVDPQGVFRNAYLDRVLGKHPATAPVSGT
jgi:L-gulono-1,4-lactone dehydrogenase